MFPLQYDTIKITMNERQRQADLARLAHLATRAKRSRGAAWPLWLGLFPSSRADRRQADRLGRVVPRDPHPGLRAPLD